MTEKENAPDPVSTPVQNGEPGGCDPATKPASSPIPAGYSNSSYIRCNNGSWEWHDPTVA